MGTHQGLRGYISENEDYGFGSGMEMDTDRRTWVNVGTDQGYRVYRSGSWYKSGTVYRSVLKIVQRFTFGKMQDISGFIST